MTTSSSLLDHHLIWIIIKYGSSHLDHLIWIIESGSSSQLDRHLIWIVIKSGSTHLDHLIWIIIKSGSSSQLDHHLIWIIIKSGSSSHMDHHLIWMIITFYLIMVLSRFFSSQEVLQSHPCRPTLHVGIHQCLYLTLKLEWPTQLLHLISSCQKGTPNTHI